MCARARYGRHAKFPPLYMPSKYGFTGFVCEIDGIIQLFNFKVKLRFIIVDILFLANSTQGFDGFKTNMIQ